MQHLESVTVEADGGGAAFRLPVQWVNRPNADFRGFAGQIVSGQREAGRSHPRVTLGGEGRVTRIVTRTGSAAAVSASPSRDARFDIDVSRGDVIAAADSPPQVSESVRGDHRVAAR